VDPRRIVLVVECVKIGHALWLLGMVVHVNTDLRAKKIYTQHTPLSGGLVLCGVLFARAPVLGLCFFVSVNAHKESQCLESTRAEASRDGSSREY